MIASNCRNIVSINVSRCSNLTPLALESITDYLLKLRTLNISFNSAMIVGFGSPQKLRELKGLKELDLSYTEVPDGKLESVVRGLKDSLVALSLEACMKVTIFGLEIICAVQSKLRKINLYETACEQQSQAELKLIEEKYTGIDLYYHRD